MKRMIGIICAISLTFGMLSGCEYTESPAKDAPSEESLSEESLPDETQPDEYSSSEGLSDDARSDDLSIGGRADMGADTLKSGGNYIGANSKYHPEKDDVDKSIDVLISVSKDFVERTKKEKKLSASDALNYEYEPFLEYLNEQLDTIDAETEIIEALAKKAEKSNDTIDDLFYSVLTDSANEIRDIIFFTYELNRISAKLTEDMRVRDANLQFYYDSMIAGWDELEKLDVPISVGELWDHYLKPMNAMRAAMLGNSKARTSNDVLSLYSSLNLISRASNTFDAYEERIIVQEEIALNQREDVLEGLKEGYDPEITPTPIFEYKFVDVIRPNLYPSQDSAVNFTVCTDQGEMDLLVRAEIDGFSQVYEQKITATPSATLYLIKPQVISNISNLSEQRDTQLKFSVTDPLTGAVYAMETHDVCIESIYDAKFKSDEFGFVETDNILAWMTPESEEILKLRRKAAEWLGDVLGYGNDSLPGYQSDFGLKAGDYRIVYNQVAALQAAISDTGVRYVNGEYSFGDMQRVLMPEAVLRSGSGICIETSILMASALLSAAMHPIILITPGHAQVAVETWYNSGQYMLIETTCLPFTNKEGEVDRLIYCFSNEDWKDYISEKEAEAAQNGGFVYVIDCDLQKQLGIKGLNYKSNL